MRTRKRLVALALVVGAVVGATSVASAQEGQPGTTPTTFTKAQQETIDCVDEAKVNGTDPDICLQAPNLILPATNELIWSGLSFLILLILLWKFAYPALKKGMEGRTERIRAELQTAEGTRAEADQVLARYQADLANAKTEATRIIEDARGTADAMRADRIRQLDEEIAELRQRSQHEIEVAKQQAIADLTNEVAALAIGAAEVVVQKNLDHGTQVRLIEDYINQVGTGSARS
jgi:F-type H+-transporting ATPase subunit b